MDFTKNGSTSKFLQILIFDYFQTFIFNPPNDKTFKYKCPRNSVFDKSYILRTEPAECFSWVCSRFNFLDNLQTCILRQFETLKSEFWQ